MTCGFQAGEPREFGDDFFSLVRRRANRPAATPRRIRPWQMRAPRRAPWAGRPANPAAIFCGTAPPPCRPADRADTARRCPACPQMVREIQHAGDQNQPVQIHAVTRAQMVRQPRRAEDAVAFAAEIFRREPAFVPRRPEPDEFADGIQIGGVAEKLVGLFVLRRAAETGGHRINEHQVAVRPEWNTHCPPARTAAGAACRPRSSSRGAGRARRDAARRTTSRDRR